MTQRLPPCASSLLSPTKAWTQDSFVATSKRTACDSGLAEHRVQYCWRCVSLRFTLCGMVRNTAFLGIPIRWLVFSSYVARTKDVLKIQWKGCQPDATTRIFGEKKVDPPSGSGSNQSKSIDRSSVVYIIYLIFCPDAARLARVTGGEKVWYLWNNDTTMLILL